MHNHDFINLDESVYCSLRFSSTSRCLVGIICRKSTADTEFDNRMLERSSRSTRLGFTHIPIRGDFNLLKVNFAEYM